MDGPKIFRLIKRLETGGAYVLYGSVKGKRFGISRERVRQIEMKALERLKTRFTARAVRDV